MYFRDADGAILVYDVTDKESFENLKEIWIKDLLEKAPENIQIAIVGNKADMTDKEIVSFKEA
jgi:GTPase SAR1 family protein